MDYSAFPFGVVILELSQIFEFILLVDILSKTFHFTIFKHPLIDEISRLKLSPSRKFVVLKTTLICLVRAPAIVPMPLLDTVLELSFVVRVLAIDLASLAMGQIIEPFAFVEELCCGQLALSVGFIMLDLPAVEAPVSHNKKCLVAVSDSIVEAAFIDGTVIVNYSSVAVGDTVFPFSLVVSRVGEEIIKI